MVKVELKLNGTKVDGYRYRQYAQRAELSPEQATALVKMFESFVDQPKPAEPPKKQ